MPNEPASKEKKYEKIKVYDFKSNIYLQPEELKAIRHSTEIYAEMISISFGNYFKEDFFVKYKGVMINKFSQILREYRPPFITFEAKIDGLEGTGFIHVSHQLMAVMMDRFLGGDAMPEWDENKEITFIEERLIFKIAERLTKYFENAYGKHAEIKLVPKSVEKKSEGIEVILPDEMITTIQVEASIREIKGIITVGFPSFLLEPVFKKFLKKQAQPASKKDIPAAYEKRSEKLKEIKVTASAELNRIKIKLRDVIDIQPGDTIMLEHQIFSPVTVKLGGKPKFTGMPGMVGKHLAVKITGIK